MQCWNVTEHKQNDNSLEEAVQDNLNKGNKVVIGGTEVIGSTPAFFSSDENLLGIIAYNTSGGGMVAVGNTNTWISSGEKDTVMIWPLTNGFVAHTTIRRVCRYKI